jgi:ParB family chromosome partitioning protein
MAAKKKAAKKATRKKAGRGGARKRLTPRREQRGPEADAIPLDSRAPALTALAAAVEAAGGVVIGGYHEPLAGHALLLATLPREAVEPTPFQRDLSPTHVKRLAQKIEETGSFLDPIIAVLGTEGGFWTPNGRHRLAAAKLLGQRQITALISPDEALAFRILALNTEKAHNLKDRSLEAIRMARALAVRTPKASEADYAAQLEAPELLTLGVVYEQAGRFAGGAYSPCLRKLERFGTKPLAKSLAERAGWASRLLEIDARVKDIIAALQQRGFRSPYLRSYVVARINPVRFHKLKKGETKPPMSVPEALTRMAASARKFDVATVRERDLALVAAVSGDPD